HRRGGHAAGVPGGHAVAGARLRRHSARGGAARDVGSGEDSVHPFLTPAVPEDARGWWRQYYRRWPEVTPKRLPPDRFELVEPLRRLAPAAVVDKDTFSAFAAPGFAMALGRLGADTLVLAGVETDVCVLATALDAVDLGYRAVVVRDATASAAPEAHT